MASFNTTVRQMTEMFQRPKCLSEKKPRCWDPYDFSEKIENKHLSVNFRANCVHFVRLSKCCFYGGHRPSTTLKTCALNRT